ncbi:MAG: phosphohistidine phosphatase [Halieaceae bacterium]
MLQRTLLLVRHAETETPRPGQDDFKRELTQRGRADAERVGNHLQVLGYEPDRVLVSSALRASQTAAIVTEQLNCATSTISYRDALYYEGGSGLTDTLLDLPDELLQVLVLAHNPAISQFAGKLSGERLHMAPCAVACIVGSSGSWAEFMGEGGRLEKFLDPSANN